MKTFVVLFSIFAFSQAVNQEFMLKFMDELREVGNKCIPEVGASDDDIARLLSHEIPTSREGRCLIFCYHRHYNMQTEDGAINEPGFMESMERLKAEDQELYDKFLKIYHICSVQVPRVDDPCDFAADLATCAVDEGRKLGLREDFMLE